MKYSIEWLKEEIDNGLEPKFNFFWSHKDDVGGCCFSQWFYSPFEVDGHVYKTCEHWMMCQKALLFDTNEKFFEILDTEHPREVKALGRTIKNFDSKVWDKKKYNIVKLGNIHKFSQHPELRKHLLSTGEDIIVESSPYDPIWGIGMSKTDKGVDDIENWKGENLLGFALMEVRNELNNL